MEQLMRQQLTNGIDSAPKVLSMAMTSMTCQILQVENGQL